MPSIVTGLYIAAGILCSQADADHCLKFPIVQQPMTHADCRDVLRSDIAAGYEEGDCVPFGDPAPGTYRLSLWKDGKPVQTIGEFQDYQTCQQRIDGNEWIDGVWQDKRFAFAEEFWCLREGE